MTKNEYLKALEQSLGQLGESERQKQLAYYEELFDDMAEDGIGESEAAALLGKPEDAAGEILRETPLTQLVKSRVRPKKGWSALSVVLAVVGSPIWLPISLALLCVMLCVYAVIWVVVAVLFAAIVAVGLSGAAAVAFAVITMGFDPPNALLIAALGIAAIGIGIAGFVGCVYVARATVKLTALIARGIRSIFIRKDGRK